MKLPHSSKESIHTVFASDLSWLGKVINFLVASECLIDLRLDVAACPHDREFLVSLSGLSKSIIFKQVTDQSDVYLIVLLEVIPSVLWLVRPDTYWVYVWTEAYVFLESSILNSRWLAEQLLNLRRFLLFFLSHLDRLIFIHGIWRQRLALLFGKWLFARWLTWLLNCINIFSGDWLVLRLGILICLYGLRFFLDRRGIIFIEHINNVVEVVIHHFLI